MFVLAVCDVSSVCSYTLEDVNRLRRMFLDDGDGFDVT